MVWPVLKTLWKAAPTRARPCRQSKARSWKLRTGQETRAAQGRLAAPRAGTSQLSSDLGGGSRGSENLGSVSRPPPGEVHAPRRAEGRRPAAEGAAEGRVWSVPPTLVPGVCSLSVPRQNTHSDSVGPSWSPGTCMAHKPWCCHLPRASHARRQALGPGLFRDDLLASFHLTPTHPPPLTHATTQHPPLLLSTGPLPRPRSSLRPPCRSSGLAGMPSAQGLCTRWPHGLEGSVPAALPPRPHPPCSSVPTSTESTAIDWHEAGAQKRAGWVHLTKNSGHSALS